MHLAKTTARPDEKHLSFGSFLEASYIRDFTVDIFYIDHCLACCIFKPIVADNYMLFSCPESIYRDIKMHLNGMEYMYSYDKYHASTLFVAGIPIHSMDCNHIKQGIFKNHGCFLLCWFNWTFRNRVAASKNFCDPSQRCDDILNSYLNNYNEI